MNGNETPSIGNSEAGNLQVQVLLCAPCFANSPEMIFEHYREVISADAAGQWFGIQAQSKKLKTESRNEKGETKRQRRAWRKPRRTLWKCRSRRWRGGRLAPPVSPGRGRKNQFMRKRRTPFAGLGVVVRRAADEFVPAIGFFYEEGGAETSDELMACAMEKLKS